MEIYKSTTAQHWGRCIGTIVIVGSDARGHEKNVEPEDDDDVEWCPSDLGLELAGEGLS